MTDYYSQRLKEHSQAKTARFQTNLPLQKPNLNNAVGTGGGDVRTLAEKPTNPGDFPDFPDGPLKNMLTHYAGKDPQFGGGIKSYITQVEALKQEFEGLGLPEDMMRKKLGNILGQYQQGSQRDQQLKQLVGAIPVGGDNNAISR